MLWRRLAVPVSVVCSCGACALVSHDRWTPCGDSGERFATLNIAVFDPMGKPIESWAQPTVRITVTNTATGVALQRRIDTLSHASIRLQAGEYSVEVGDSSPWMRTKSVVRLAPGCVVSKTIRLRFAPRDPGW